MAFFLNFPIFIIRFSSLIAFLTGVIWFYE